MKKGKTVTLLFLLESEILQQKSIKAYMIKQILKSHVIFTVFLEKVKYHLPMWGFKNFSQP